MRGASSSSSRTKRCVLPGGFRPSAKASRSWLPASRKNGGADVTREVEERVSQAIRELGYSADPLARGMITGRTGSVGYPVARWSADRFQGLADAFAGSDARLVQHAVGDAVAAEGERNASSVLLGAEPPDAVVAYNDLIALGLLGQSHALGVPVPQAVAIAGFDDILDARYAFPALTRVDMGGERMGEVAMRRLAARIQDPQSEPGHDDLAPRLKVRATTRRRG